MRPTRRLLPSALGLLTAVLWLAGCSGPLVRNAPDAEAPADFPHHTAAQIVRLVQTSTAGVASFRSEARLRIESPRLSQRVGASLRARLADSLLVSLRGPLGIHVGRALVTADSFFAIDQLNNAYLYGPLDVAERYVPGAGEPGALAQNLLGLLVPEAGVPWEVRADSSVYVLTAPGAQRRYVVDPSVWRVIRLEERAADGLLLTRRTFDAFDVVEGRVVPRRVVLASPPDETEVTVEHQRLTLAPADLDFRFVRPRDAERIPLE